VSWSGRHLLKLTATVTHVTSDGVDDVFGDATTTTTTSQWPCWLSQGERDEKTNNVAVTMEQWTLFLPPEAFGAVAAEDRVDVDGRTFEVHGPPWDAVNPRTGQASHVVATLKRTV
jgi:hypothetical protein